MKQRSIYLPYRPRLVHAQLTATLRLIAILGFLVLLFSAPNAWGMP